MVDFTAVVVSMEAVDFMEAQLVVFMAATFTVAGWLDHPLRDASLDPAVRAGESADFARWATRPSTAGTGRVRVTSSEGERVVRQRGTVLFLTPMACGIRLRAQERELPHRRRLATSRVRQATRQGLRVHRRLSVPVTPIVSGIRLEAVAMLLLQKLRGPRAQGRLA
ncbi:MAG TPA: hypothetical protein VEV41_20170 [Terriglobales bacterium]|nr:hypothetical protein [Terriglobales bacterium]